MTDSHTAADPLSNTSSFQAHALLSLLQLANSALPVGAYSYSEGLETLVQTDRLKTDRDLQHWLTQELCYGGIRLEAAMVLRAYRAIEQEQPEQLQHWNQWFSAARETEELRQQSWHMGRALVRLLSELEPELGSWLSACGHPCNFAIAFGTAAAYWHIPLEHALLGYLHSWASNLINAGVKLIPLGQTAGQMLLHTLQPMLSQTAVDVLHQSDDDLANSGWGLAIASMQHETLYSRLFRS